MNKRTFHLIVNPASGKGKGKKSFPLIQRLLNERNVKYTYRLTNKPEDATKQTKDHPNDTDIIVAVGGDGTLNEVVNGIMCKKNTLGFISTGSGNDFIKASGIPLDIKSAVDLLITNPAKKIDVCSINDKYYINGSGIGFDAVAGNEANKLKWLHGLPGYICALIKSIPKFSPPNVSIKLDNEEFTSRIFLCGVGNGISIGGGFKITPKALLDDGLLDICLVKPVSLFEMMLYVPKVLKGTHTELPVVIYRKSKKISIRSEDPLPVHIDGEIYSLDAKSIDIEVIPAALPVIVGESSL